MTQDSGTVAICMATYNGEKYIREQLESILAQTYKNWFLFMRDDGSTDRTKEILQAYAKIDERIKVLNDPALRGGSARKNFAAIHKWVSENYKFAYFMFSDQDDVWLENKIELCMGKMKLLEKENHGAVLIHTDLRVVDESLRVLSESFWKYSRLDPDVKDLNLLLVQNNVTGCTMFWNRELNECLNLQNDAVVMHDWWVALVASCFGRIEYIDKPTVLYRQHGKNVLGAAKVNSLGFIMKRLLDKKYVTNTLRLSMQQASGLLDVYKKDLSQKQIDAISRFSKLSACSKFEKIYTVLRWNYLKQGVVKKIGEIMYI